MTFVGDIIEKVVKPQTAAVQPNESNNDKSGKKAASVAPVRTFYSKMTNCCKFKKIAFTSFMWLNRKIYR